jgi:hypothetical protein
VKLTAECGFCDGRMVAEWDESCPRFGAPSHRGCCSEGIVTKRGQCPQCHGEGQVCAVCKGSVDEHDPRTCHEAEYDEWQEREPVENEERGP